MIGETIDRYRVVEKLGQGGMGVVYKARDTLLGRFVALKALPAESVADPERRRRFIDEAKAASALQHRGIVAIHDVLSADGQDYIVMEFVSGETLEQRMGQRALPLSRGLRYAEQVADALARAHAAGIVHRDLKPSNVMVTEDDTAKILDFGLAKLAEAPFPDEDTPTLSAGHHGKHLSREGAIAGTLAYMSPEQAAGKPVDARTDVFSFGVLLYQMLTGRHPFLRGSQLETLSAIREGEPEPPTKVAPGLPPEAERAILRCLHKEPSRRWQSMADLSAVLRDLREDSESGREGGPTPAARSVPGPWWWVGAASGARPRGDHGGRALPRYGGPSAPGPLELTRLTFDTGLDLATPGSRADGKLVAYCLRPRRRRPARRLGPARRPARRGTAHARPRRRLAAVSVSRRLTGGVSLRGRARRPLRRVDARRLARAGSPTAAVPAVLARRVARLLRAGRGLHARRA